MKLNGRFVGVAALLLGLLGSGSARADHKSNAFKQVNLISDQTNVARVQDPNLVNSWGIIQVGSRLWVADNGTDLATSYSLDGDPRQPIVHVPAPTGLALNESDAFEVSLSCGQSQGAPALLVFASEDGHIYAYSPAVDRNNAIAVITGPTAPPLEPAVYKGIAVSTPRHGKPSLYAADFTRNSVEQYDKDFGFIRSFTDPMPPSFCQGKTADNKQLTCGPFNVAVIDDHLFVTFAQRTEGESDENHDPGLGFVDVFDLDGTFDRRFATGGTLNAPWGIALAPRGFNDFSGDILIGNFGDGAISAFRPSNGAFQGQLEDCMGHVIKIDGLWGLLFLDDHRRRDRLFFASGPDGEDHGLVGFLEQARCSSSMTFDVR